MMGNKKGLSAIVATLIIILLAIVAFGIVSVVVKSTVTKGAESIELSGKCLDVEIKVIKVVEADPFVRPGIYNVTLSRTASGAPIDGVDLIFIDAANENSVKKARVRDNIQPLDKFTLEVSLAGDNLVPAKVTVIPFFMKDSGDLYYCENSFTFKIQ